MSYNNMELLSPAGDMLSLKAAVNNGCNAVYLGGKNFNARSSATNFDDEELKEAVEYCTLRGVKVFVVVNILYKEEEISELLEFVTKAYNAGVYAFIVQDVGVGMFIKQHFKDVKLHASTQLNAHSLNDVLYLQSLGFDRVILARELSIEEIKEIKSKVKVEIEIFGHGALCVSHSGQCLLSSFIGKRSGNRGKCAGTCRLKFDLVDSKNKVQGAGHLLSTKDLMTLEILEELYNIGVDSIKLEGRMKNYEYVGLITKMYREHLDSFKNLDSKNKKMVTQIFNRGGELGTGYLENYSGKSMMSTETPKSSGVQIGYVRHYSKAQGLCTIRLEDEVVAGDGIEIWTSTKPHVGTNVNVKATEGEDITVSIRGNIQKGDKVYKSYDKALNDLLKNIYKDKTQQEINGTVIAKLNEPIKLVLYNEEISIEKYGAVLEEAQKAPMTEDKIVEKLSKTGNTPFKINFYDNEVDENIYINISSINELKREALEELESVVIKNLKRKSEVVKYEKQSNEKVEEKYLTVHVTNVKMLEKVVKAKPYRIYLEYFEGINKEIDTFIDMVKSEDIEFFIAFPKITNTNAEKKISSFIEEVKERELNIDGYCISNYGQRYLLSKKDKITFDYNFNALNSITHKFLTKNDNKTIATLSPELTVNELKNLSNKNSEVVIHGKLPMMLTPQCPVGLYIAGKDEGRYCSMRGHKERYYLKDRVGKDFLIKCNCDSCYAEILGCEYLFMLNKFDDLKNINTKFYKVVLSDEREVTKLLLAYKSAINGEKDKAYDELVETYKEKGMTHGLMYKGVL